MFENETRTLTLEEEKAALERVRFTKDVFAGRTLLKHYKRARHAKGLKELGNLAGFHMRTRELESQLEANRGCAGELWNDAQEWHRIWMESWGEAIEILAEKLGA